MQQIKNDIMIQISKDTIRRRIIQCKNFSLKKKSYKMRLNSRYKYSRSWNCWSHEDNLLIQSRLFGHEKIWMFLTVDITTGFNSCTSRVLSSSFLSNRWPVPYLPAMAQVYQFDSLESGRDRLITTWRHLLENHLCGFNGSSV